MKNEPLLNMKTTDAQVIIGEIGSGKSALMESIAERAKYHGSLIIDMLGATDGEGLFWAVPGTDKCNYECDNPKYYKNCKKTCPFGFRKETKFNYDTLNFDPEVGYNCHTTILVHPEYVSVTPPSSVYFDHIIPYEFPNHPERGDLAELLRLAKREKAVITIADNLFEIRPHAHLLQLLTYLQWHLGDVNQDELRTDITLLAREIGTIVFNRMRIFPVHEEDLKRSFLYAVRFLRHLGVRYLWDLQRGQDLDIGLRLLTSRVYIKKQSKRLLGDKFMPYWYGVNFRRNVWLREHGFSKLNRYWPQIGSLPKGLSYVIFSDEKVRPAIKCEMAVFHHRKPHEDFRTWTGTEWKRVDRFRPKFSGRAKEVERVKGQRDVAIRWIVEELGQTQRGLMLRLKNADVGIGKDNLSKILTEA